VATTMWAQNRVTKKKEVLKVSDYDRKVLESTGRRLQEEGNVIGGGERNKQERSDRTRAILHHVQITLEPNTSEILRWEWVSRRGTGRPAISGRITRKEGKEGRNGH